MGDYNHGNYHRVPEGERTSLFPPKRETVVKARDPRENPETGDVLYQKDNTYKLYVDFVNVYMVYYRVVDESGDTLLACRTTIDNWRKKAPDECEMIYSKFVQQEKVC